MRSHFGLISVAIRLADHDRAILVEGAMVAEARDIEFQRFRFQQPLARHIVDHQMREIRLAGDRAERGEFRRGETHHVDWCRPADWARGRAAPRPGVCGHSTARPSCRAGELDRCLRGLLDIIGLRCRRLSQSRPAPSPGLFRPHGVAVEAAPTVHVIVPRGSHDRHRRHHRPRNSRQPRQSHGRSRCGAGRRLGGPRRGAVGRLHRRA